MRPTLFICSLIISAASVIAAPSSPLSLDAVQGRPVVTGVYLNGQGPYRFLLDTGAQTNQVAASLARELGMAATFRVELSTAAGSQLVPGTKIAQVRLGTAEAINQEFLLTDLAAARSLNRNIDGVLGQEFLAKFDYRLDFQHHQLTFGSDAASGTKVAFDRRDGTMVIPTSEGNMVLDSGTAAVILFRRSASPAAQIQTAAGFAAAAVSESSRIRVAGRDYRPRQTAFATASYTGQAGLLPASLFKAVFICNSGNYIVVE